MLEAGKRMQYEGVSEPRESIMGCQVAAQSTVLHSKQEGDKRVLSDHSLLPTSALIWHTSLVLSLEGFWS